MTDSVNPTYEKQLRRMYGYFYEQGDLFTKSIKPIRVKINHIVTPHLGIRFVTHRAVNNIVLLCDPVIDIIDIRTPAIYSDDLYKLRWIITSYGNLDVSPDSSWEFGKFVTFGQVKSTQTIESTFSLEITELAIYGPNSNNPFMP